MLRRSFALLIWLLLPSLALGQTQDVAAIAKRLQSDWRRCVDLAATAGAAEQVDLIGPAENVFRSCATEEQLFLAFANGAAPTKEGADTMIVSHYRDKLALKKQISDDYFKRMTREIRKQ